MKKLIILAYVIVLILATVSMCQAEEYVTEPYTHIHFTIGCQICITDEKIKSLEIRIEKLETEDSWGKNGMHALSDQLKVGELKQMLKGASNEKKVGYYDNEGYWHWNIAIPADLPSKPRR